VGYEPIPVGQFGQAVAKLKPEVLSFKGVLTLKETGAGSAASSTSTEFGGVAYEEQVQVELTPASRMVSKTALKLTSGQPRHARPRAAGDRQLRSRRRARGGEAVLEGEEPSGAGRGRGRPPPHATPGGRPHPRQQLERASFERAGRRARRARRAATIGRPGDGAGAGRPCRSETRGAVEGSAPDGSMAARSA